MANKQVSDLKKVSTKRQRRISGFQDRQMLNDTGSSHYYHIFIGLCVVWTITLPVGPPLAVIAAHVCSVFQHHFIISVQVCHHFLGSLSTDDGKLGRLLQHVSKALGGVKVGSRGGRFMCENASWTTLSQFEPDESRLSREYWNMLTEPSGEESTEKDFPSRRKLLMWPKSAAFEWGTKDLWI